MRNFGALNTMSIANVDLSSDASVDTVEVVDSSKGASPFSVLVAPAKISGSHTTAEDDLIPTKCAVFETGCGGGLSTGSFERFKSNSSCEGSIQQPHCDGKIDEIQLVTTSCDTPGTLGGSFTLSYRSGNDSISADADAPTVEGLLKTLQLSGLSAWQDP